MDWSGNVIVYADHAAPLTLAILLSYLFLQCRQMIEEEELILESVSLPFLN